MKVFISWSGERSQILGQALYDWIPMVLQSIIPWLSKADIEAGERWADKISKELEDCNFGILCVTRENISSPWILFEAGALAKLMQEGRVIPLLLDIEFKDVTGPLAQFQAKKVEREGIFDVIAAMNNISDTKLSETQLPKQFSVLWPQLDEQIGGIPKGSQSTKKHRPEHEVLEELVSNIRGLDARLRDSFDFNPEMRRPKRVIHPAMIKEVMRLADVMGSSPHDPLRFLIFASLIKEEVPWFYELASDAYLQTVNTTPRAKAARQRMIGAFKMLQRGPWMDILYSKDIYIMFREIERYFDEFEIMDGDLNHNQSAGEFRGDIIGKILMDKQDSKTLNRKPESDNSGK